VGADKPSESGRIKKESARADFPPSEGGRAPTIVSYKCILQEGDGAAITSIAKEIEIGGLDSVDLDATKPACR